ATFRRLVVQDRLVREGRWREGRPMLYELPRLMGQTLGFVAFGHVARAVAVRARPFGVHMLAYDPYIEELVMSQYGVEPVGLSEVRSGAAAASGPGDRTGTSRPMAQELREPRGPPEDRAGTLAALLHGTRAGRVSVPAEVDHGL